MSSGNGSTPRQPAPAELDGLIRLIRHDRTNALLVVEGYLEIIRTLDDELPLAAADALRRAVDQLTEHIDGLSLAWALDAGAVAADYGPVELVALVAAAVESLSEDQAAATRTSNSTEALLTWAVPGHVQRAVRNALTAAHRSTVTDTVEISVGETETAGVVMLRWEGPAPSEGEEDEETLDAVSALDLYNGSRLVELGGGSVTRTNGPGGQLELMFSLPFVAVAT